MNDQIIHIGVIGYGYWGPNIVRNFAQTDGCKVVKVADNRSERLALLERQFPSIMGTADADSVINDPAIDAIVIATPVLSHYSLAKQAILKRKHVLVEKPITTSVAEAEELLQLAAQKKVCLMVNHTFLYTPAVRKMKQLVDAGELGALNYYDSTRINLGMFQHDVNVVWDLAPHDISILYYLTNQRATGVSATGIDHLGNGLENIAYVTLHFANKMIAHFTCSWSSPVKIRKILLGGDQKMIMYDDVETSEKIRVYDVGYSAMNDDENKRRLQIDYRTGDVFIPKVEMKEALAEIAIEFLACIRSGEAPLSDGNLGLDVVKVLEAAAQSIKRNGQEIKIN